MKVLLDQNECDVLMHAAEHLKVDMGQPQMVYEIENPALATIAIALGGQCLETEERPMPIGILPGETNVKVNDRSPLPNPPHPADGAGTENTCEICGSEIIGKNKGAKVCSKACEAERGRRYVNAARLRKLRKQAETQIGRDLDEIEEAGAEPEVPLANGSNPG